MKRRTLLGIPLVPCPGIPKGTLLVVPTRRAYETFEEWARRCARIENIGEADMPQKAYDRFCPW